jgi:osmoprotectant transport system permease protein
MILAGAIPAAILALLFDFILGFIQKFIKQLIKPIIVIFILIIILIIPFIIVPSFSKHPLNAGFTGEFMERSDGYPGLKDHYNLSLHTLELDPGLMYQALKEKKVDVICGFSTDGRIRAYNLKILEDDKNYFPPYYATPLVRGETLRRYPELRKVFSKLAGQITDEEMTKLNYRVDNNKEPVSSVSKDFIIQLGLDVKENDGNPDIIIGSKNFTEQYILAQIFKYTIESYTNLNVALQTGLAGTKICFDALTNGEIDMYPEYTGTGLHVILKADETLHDTILRNEKKLYDFVKNESKARFDLEWLQPLGFNNSYALMMREKHAQRLSINTISELKNYLDQTD